MLLSASILLLGCSYAFADGHANSMGCCNKKVVSGSGSKSGLYYLDVNAEVSIEKFPHSCKDQCVYRRESGPGMFCFKPSSMYTVECEDTGAMVDISGDESTSGGMGGHGDNDECSFSERENVDADNQRYTIDNIKTDEEGVLKFVFWDVAMITFNIIGAEAPASQSFTCTVKQITTECSSDVPIPAGTYTIEVKSPNEIKWENPPPQLTNYFVGDKGYCGDHGSDTTMDAHNSMDHENTASSMASHGDAKCDFSSINSVDDQFYKFDGIKTDEEGILKFVFADPSASVKLSLEGQNTQFECVNEECKANNAVPAGTYTVEVQYLYRDEDGTIPQMFEDGKWTTAPLIKTYHVGDKNYCEGEDSHNDMGDHGSDTTMADHNDMGDHGSDTTMGDHNSMGDHSDMGMGDHGKK